VVNGGTQPNDVEAGWRVWAERPSPRDVGWKQNGGARKTQESWGRKFQQKGPIKTLGKKKIETVAKRLVSSKQRLREEFHHETI